MLRSVRLLKYASLLACALTLCVMALGAYTRLIDAGLGCPDWPGCYGHFIVPNTIDAIEKTHIIYPNTPLISQKAWAEMIHRYAAAGLSLILLLLFIQAFRQKTLPHQNASRIALCLLLSVICYQILLGRLTVTWKLLPIVVTQHLLGGMAILGLFYLNYQLLKPNNPILFRFSHLLSSRMLAGSSLILLLLQLFLGAWTSTNYAALSCPDIPFCHNQGTITQWDFHSAFHFFSRVGLNYQGGVFSQTIRETIQMTHRFGALIVSLVFFALIMTINLNQNLKAHPLLPRLSYVLLLLLCLQITLGFINVLYHLPIVSAILHNLVAGLILLTLITINLQFYLIRSGEKHD